jgi:hypothetical protein
MARMVNCVESRDKYFAIRESSRGSTGWVVLRQVFGFGASAGAFANG